jgi:LuxR family maltose regulon positive regulatory protein
MGRYRREPAMCRLIGRLPGNVLDRRPVLLVEFAGALLSIHEFERVETLLDTAERLVAPGQGADLSGTAVVVDRDAFERLPAMLALYRAAMAKVGEREEEHLAHARRVLELVTADDHLSRGGAEAFLGLAAWGRGELDEAYRWYAAGMASLERAGRIADLVGGAITTTDIRLAQGRLSDALTLSEAGLELGTRGGRPSLRGVADMHTNIGEIRYQRNDLAGAASALEESLRLGDELGFPRHHYLSRLLQARLRQAGGDIEGALEAFNEAERSYVADFSPNVRPVAAQRAAMLIAHGRLAEARRWAAEAGVALGDPASYVREYELLTLARLTMAEARGGIGQPDDLQSALGLLDRLIEPAETGKRNGSVLEIRIAEALARHAAGDSDGAIDALEAAAAIGEPEGYVRVFLDAGPSMTALLRVVAKRRDARGYLGDLLAAAAMPAADRPRPAKGLVEPLSERELEVLRLLRSELSGPDMARELVVSLNTFRTHTRNIYAKLGVTSRLAALRRAQELELL